MPSRRPSVRVEYELVPEEPVARPYSSVNVRREDKEVFDQLQLWWSMTERDLTQWDAFSRVIALVLTHPEADLPPAGVWKAP